MKIDTHSTIFLDTELRNIEKVRSAKYVCETCIRNRDGVWVNTPVVVFYQEKPHPEGSNYFGLFYQTILSPESPSGFKSIPMITNAITATEEFQGAIAGDEVIYSHYRHHCWEKNGVIIDGGRDYLKCTEQLEPVTLKIVKDKLTIV